MLGVNSVLGELRETAISETSGAVAGRLSELEPYGTVVHESPAVYIKQYIAFPASAMIWVIFTPKGFWSTVS